MASTTVRLDNTCSFCTQSTNLDYLKIIYPCLHQVCKPCYEDWTDKKNCKICKILIQTILPPIVPLERPRPLSIPFHLIVNGSWMCPTENCPCKNTDPRSQQSSTPKSSFPL
jgi:hypothetical protein